MPEFSLYTFRIESETGVRNIIGPSVNGGENNSVRTSIMYATNVPYGSTIEANGESFWSAAFVTQLFESTFYTEFEGGTTGYLGLQFRDQLGAVYYGWASIVREPDSLEFALTGFGYNDSPGEGAVVGAVPEPTVTGLIALTGGMVALRRKRKAKAV